MKHSILIIDDSVANINTLYIMLKEQYQVFVAKNGKDGLEQAVNNQCSLILLDILMPEMNGFEVLELLMKNPKTKSIPVMFITSLNDDENEEKGLRLGAVDYITKPFSPSVIKAKVKNHIELFEYRRTIENIAMLDGLTGVPNRRSYNEKVEEYWNNAFHTGTKISIAIVDIDCFKEYNDNYGHLQGDIVLKKVAEVLYNSLPNNKGYVARYGGEEFIVILRDVEEKKAYEIMDNMRKNVMALHIEHLHSKAGKEVTVSIGGNTIRPASREIDKFVDDVDKRLYVAKSLGRNQVVWEDREKAKGQIEAFLFGHLRLLSQQGSFTSKNEEVSQVLLFLVYLIANRQSEYTKTDLIQAIWLQDSPKDMDDQLKQLLEQTKEELAVMKLSYLDELIVMRSGTYHWNNSYMCIVDVEVFENIYLQVQNEPEEDKVYQLCERAVVLYNDDFLSKVLHMCWINTLRDKYRNMYYELLSLLLSICYAREEYHKIIDLSRRVICLGGIDSRVHYYYLKALIQLKRNKEALEHFEYIVQSYYTVLGSTPPESILDIYLEIIESGEKQAFTIEQVEGLMKEKGVALGAYYCNVHVFKSIYQLWARKNSRSGKVEYLGLMNIEDRKFLTEAKHKKLIQQLHSIIQNNLRVEDIFCKVSETQYAILLACDEYKQATMIMERIIEKFNHSIIGDWVVLHFELSPIDPVETVPMEEALGQKNS